MRQLTEEEISEHRKEHLEKLTEIDIKIEDKKETAATYNQELKILHERERDLREMLKTGQAQPEQMTVTLTAADLGEIRARTADLKKGG